jgi:hypothetical protein
MKLVERVFKLSIGCAFLLITLPASAENMQLPSGWRTPTSAELNDNWRNKGADKYVIARGDFNGDGVIDQAMLLVSRRGQGLGLFVFLSQKDNTFKPYSIDVIKDVSFVRAMGIARILPGRYKTACGKGYWDCKKGEAPEISIEHDAIDYFKTESANSYFYWNKQAQAFKRVWISD